MRQLLLLLCLSPLSSTSAQTIITQTALGKIATPSYEPLRRDDGTISPAACGIWRARGYGYLAVIKPKSIQLFNETQSLLWPQSDFDPDSLLLSASAKGKQLLATPDLRIPPFVLERLDAFPDKQQPQEWTKQLIYQAFAETMSEQYVFFEERKFDWPARQTEVRPRLAQLRTDTQLFDAIEQSLQGIDDGHVQLGATIDSESRRPMFGVSGTEQEVAQAFEKQSQITNFEDYLAGRIQSFETGIATKVLQGKPRQSCNELTWGTMKNNIGYLHIASMGGFSESESLDVQLAELHEALDQILTELAGSRALIVDVSTNGGGSDVFSHAIACHFADQRRLAFTKGPKRFPDIQHSIYVEPFKRPNGNGVTYTKPIYLAINDVTMSAAEIFVLCMKDLPHVTTVGKATRGALSDVLSKTLPNGWAFGLSNEIYLDSKGECFEAKGIAPKIPMELIDPSKSSIGHADAILRIAEMALDE